MPKNLHIEIRQGTELPRFAGDVDESLLLTDTAARLREYLATEAMGKIAPGETTVFILTAVEEAPETGPTPRAMHVVSRPQGEMHEVWFEKPDVGGDLVVTNDPWARWGGRVVWTKPTKER